MALKVFVGNVNSNSKFIKNGCSCIVYQNMETMHIYKSIYVWRINFSFLSIDPLELYAFFKYNLYFFMHLESFLLCTESRTLYYYDMIVFSITVFSFYSGHILLEYMVDEKLSWEMKRLGWSLLLWHVTSRRHG